MYDYNAARFEKFRDTYIPIRHQLANEQPSLFGATKKHTLDELITLTVNAIKSEGIRSVIISSEGFKRTAKALGIKNNYKSWEAYLSGAE